MESDFKNSDSTIKKALVLVTGVLSYWLYQNPTGILSLAIVICISYCIKTLISYEKRRILRILWRDVRSLYKLLKIHFYLKKMVKNDETIPKVFRRTCDEQPNKIMFRFEDESWTFKQVDEFSNKVANYFSSKGVAEGDTVAIFMETRMEYVPLWLGLQKIGANASLINHNITGDQLIHSLNAVANTKILIYGPEVKNAFIEILDSTKHMEHYFYGNEDPEELKNCPGINLRKELLEAKDTEVKSPSTGNTDTGLYIFTSGTTGMPKAAILTHARMISMATAAFHYMGFRKDDVLYVCLPLYHTNGACMGAVQAIVSGITVVLRKKFSASNFWKDCIKYNCTLFIYIGELCRFLLAAEPSQYDRAHKIRLMYGNGLRSTIWERFVNRFGIRHVAEFYGSSEGIGPLTNTEGIVGSVGQFPLIWKNIFPVYLIKIDPETDMPLRDRNGRCILVKPNEPGMHIAKIMKGNISTDFKGYSDKSSTSKKIIHDVFEDGDSYYLSGDIFTYDDDLFLYFQDRTGDTFRWRGENVSTTEVEQIITDIVGLQDAAVYGVVIPGTEGRAGMAAIAGEPSEVGLQELNAGLKRRLAKYARPIFLRYVSTIEMTSTYKIKKKQLMSDGFDPGTISDPVFYNNQKEDKYLRLTTDVYNDIITGKLPF